jgi:SHS2 domain-containing protein
MFPDAALQEFRSMSAPTPAPKRPALTGGAWETFAHGADVGVRGYGASLSEAFANAAMALTSVVADPATVRPQVGVEISCAAPDCEILLLDWLNQLVSRMSADRLLFSRFEVEVEHERLDGVAVGEPIDVARHQPAVEVKGATFTELEVARDPDGRWRAQCVVDV